MRDSLVFFLAADAAEMEVQDDYFFKPSMFIETASIDIFLPLSIAFDVFTVTSNLKFNSIRKFNFTTLLFL